MALTVNWPLFDPVLASGASARQSNDPVTPLLALSA
jgi:hypothetical protein